MKILILGSGGREHALGVRLLHDPVVSTVFVYPGNVGMKFTNRLIPTLGLEFKFEEALKIVREEEIALVVSGPEAPLYEGWIDRFKKEGIPAFGPSKDAAFLEQSKIKSKRFMDEYQIPTAPFEAVKNLEEAIAVIQKHSDWKGFVLKLSGPALGKGVVVTGNKDEAIEAATEFFQHSPPGIEEGMIIEEKMMGPEVSLFYICSDQSYQYLSSACDHKRLLDGDQGPNTGGMGAYSPAPFVNRSFLDNIENKFLIPTLRAMGARGTPFHGILFLGILMRNDEPFLLEYNVRFGDPETQAILPRLQGNLATLFLSVALNDIKVFEKTKMTESNVVSVHVVKAAKGYPGVFGQTIEKDQMVKIKGPISDRHSQFYFAGVKAKGDNLVTSGGRVLGVTVIEKELQAARAETYRKLATITFPGEQFRKDIGVTK